jgi:hypothetical protein
MEFNKALTAPQAAETALNLIAFWPEYFSRLGREQLQRHLYFSNMKDSHAMNPFYYVPASHVSAKRSYLDRLERWAIKPDSLDKGNGLFFSTIEGTLASDQKFVDRVFDKYGKYAHPSVLAANMLPEVARLLAGLAKDGKITDDQLKGVIYYELTGLNSRPKLRDDCKAAYIANAKGRNGVVRRGPSNIAVYDESQNGRFIFPPRRFAYGGYTDGPTYSIVHDLVSGQVIVKSATVASFPDFRFPDSSAVLIKRLKDPSSPDPLRAALESIAEKGVNSPIVSKYAVNTSKRRCAYPINGPSVSQFTSRGRINGKQHFPRNQISLDGEFGPSFYLDAVKNTSPDTIRTIISLACLDREEDGFSFFRNNRAMIQNSFTSSTAKPTPLIPRLPTMPIVSNLHSGGAVDIAAIERRAPKVVTYLRHQLRDLYKQDDEVEGMIIKLFSNNTSSIIMQAWNEYGPHRSYAEGGSGSSTTDCSQLVSAMVAGLGRHMLPPTAGMDKLALPWRRKGTVTIPDIQKMFNEPGWVILTASKTENRNHFDKCNHVIITVGNGLALQCSQSSKSARYPSPYSKASARLTTIDQNWIRIDKIALFADRLKELGLPADARNGSYIKGPLLWFHAGVHISSLPAITPTNPSYGLYQNVCGLNGFSGLGPKDLNLDVDIPPLLGNLNETDRFSSPTAPSARKFNAAYSNLALGSESVSPERLFSLKELAISERLSSRILAIIHSRVNLLSSTTSLVSKRTFAEDQGAGSSP